MVFTIGNWTFTKCKPLGSELLCPSGIQAMCTPHAQTWTPLVKLINTLGNVLKIVSVLSIIIMNNIIRFFIIIIILNDDIIVISP